MSERSEWGPRWWLLLLCVALVTAGCQVDVEVEVVVAEDGTGEVAVGVALDEAAAARVPDLAEQLEVDDLVATGWTVTGPVLEGDGRTWVRASKPFGSVEGAGVVLDEISGPGGPFRSFDVRRSPSLLTDRWELRGTVDLTSGLAGFSDAALRDRLDGTDVGLTEEELVAAAGRPLDEALTFSVAVVLPGDVTVDGAGGGSAGVAVWEPVLGEALDIAATGTRRNTTTVAWLAVAATAVLALVVLLVMRARRRWRRRGVARPRSDVGTVGR